MTECPAYHLMSLDNFNQGTPYGQIAELRSAGPISWEADESSERGGHWNVFTKDLIDQVMKAPDIFSNSGGPRLEDLPASLDRDGLVSLNLMDRPDHPKYRAMVDYAFKPEAIKRREEPIRAIARKLIDSIIDDGECDFVKAVALQLPLDVICWILGMPQEDKARVCGFTNTMMIADDPDFSTSAEDGQRAQRNLVRYGIELAADHRENPRDSLTMDMLRAELNGEMLSDLEYGLFFLNLIIGGIETTRNTAGFGLYELIKHPDQFLALTKDPSLIPDAVEEILRYRAPITYYRRTALADAKVGGETIKKGDKVICWLASANRDDKSFGDPDLFDITRCQRERVRTNQRTFGVGSHFCIGVHLARLQLNVLLEEIAARMKNVQLAGDPKTVRSVFLDGFKEMNITFENI